MNVSPKAPAIEVNGEARALTVSSVLDLVRAEGVDPSRKGVAVALNGQVVKRSAWPETLLKSGDRVEIVRAFPGG